MRLGLDWDDFLVGSSVGVVAAAGVAAIAALAKESVIGPEPQPPTALTDNAGDPIPKPLEYAPRQKFHSVAAEVIADARRHDGDGVK